METEKYTILENRPELNAEQIAVGMDFAKISAKATYAKTALVKTMLVKIVAAVLLLSTAIVLIYKYKHAPVANEQVIGSTVAASPVITNAPAANADTVANEIPSNAYNGNANKSGGDHFKSTIDTVETSKKMNVTPTEVSSAAVPFDSNKVALNTSLKEQPKKNGPPENSNSLPFKGSNKVTHIKRCALWKAEDKCKIPHFSNAPNRFDINASNDGEVNCSEIVQGKNALKAVWVTVGVNEKSVFNLETHLKNIALVRASDGAILHPVMVGVSGYSNFIGNTLDVKKFAANFNKQLDLFLFFEDANIGDKIVIKNFIENEIVE